jgi:hypothetical protein
VIGVQFQVEVPCELPLPSGSFWQVAYNNVGKDLVSNTMILSDHADISNFLFIQQLKFEIRVPNLKSEFQYNDLKVAYNKDFPCTCTYYISHVLWLWLSLFALTSIVYFSWYYLYFLNYFDVLIVKIKIKNNILIYFKIKKIL